MFKKVGALDASQIARWNGTVWAALGAGLPDEATAIAHDATTGYASNFDEGASTYLLGNVDGTARTELARSPRPAAPRTASSTSTRSA